MNSTVLPVSGFIYLGSRYSAPTKREQHENYLAALHATAWLLKAGHFMYSPIVHCHEIARLHDMKTDALSWEAYNHAMIDSASSIIALQNRDWRKSPGLREELEYAEAQHKPRYWMVPSLKREYVIGELFVTTMQLYALTPGAFEA